MLKGQKAQILKNVDMDVVNVKFAMGGKEYRKMYLPELHLLSRRFEEIDVSG